MLTDIGDMIIEHSSGGNSTKVLLASEKEKHKSQDSDWIAH